MYDVDYSYPPTVKELITYYRLLENIKSNLILKMDSSINNLNNNDEVEITTEINQNPKLKTKSKSKTKTKDKTKQNPGPALKSSPKIESEPVPEPVSEPVSESVSEPVPEHEIKLVIEKQNVTLNEKNKERVPVRQFQQQKQLRSMNFT